MTKRTVPQLNLKRFTFFALEFASTPVTTWRGERFRAAVNRMYLPFIRSGWPVPLSFVIDVCTMLLSPGTLPSGWDRHSLLPPEFRRLATRYSSMLMKLRQHPVFETMAQLVQGVSEMPRQDQAINAFLKFLVAGASGFENIYSFDSRELKIEQAIINERGVGLVAVGADQRPKQEQFRFRGLKALREFPETIAIHDVLMMLCQYFEDKPLEEIITPDLQLVLEIAARTRTGTGRVDYRFLSWLLLQPGVDDVETLPPNPRVVQEFEPTNVHEIEGQTGGYIDVAKRKFRGSLGEVLPSELSLWKNRALTLQKFLNEGVVTYVRENFEYVENELRVLFCFVIDASQAMRQARANAPAELGKGLTPYIRARALAALMMQDLSRFLPREDVRIDCGVYVWSSQDPSSPSAEATCEATVDLFSWTQAEAENRLNFLRGLTVQMPELFYARLTQEDSEARPELEPGPFDFIDLRHRSKRYHCRHVVILSCSTTIGELTDGAPPLGLDASDSGPDSIHFVTCDVDQKTVGIARVGSLDYGADYADGVLPGRLSENRLRYQFVNTVLLKGAGRPSLETAGELWEQLS